MAFWGVEVKPGESYIQLQLQPHSHSNSRLLRITKATLGNCHHSGWSMVQYTASDKKENSVMLCALNPKIIAMCRLELEFKEDDNFVLSAHGQSPIHLSGYYIHSHNDGQRHHTDNSTGKNAEIPQSSNCKPIQTEEALHGELKLQQDARINGYNNGDHRFSNEWNNHDKDANTGHENSGLPHGTSWNTKEVFKKTGSEDEDHYDDLPIMHAFEKRRAAKNGGAKIHTKKRKYSGIPGKEKFLSVQNNLMDQLNEQRYSKMMESNGVPTKDITPEDNIVQTANRVKNAIQNEGHDGVTNQIIVQSAPPIKISDEGRCFTVAAKRTVKKHGNKGKNENRTRKLDRELMQQQDAQINGHNNGDHRCSNEWNRHVKGADIDREKNGLPHGTSWNTKKVFKKPTGSEDEDHDDDLPIMVAFEKRRAAKNGGAKIHTKKRNCGTPGKEKLPRVQNNVMDQLNEQRHSKMVESNAVRNKDDITKEENIVQTASLAKNATQNEGHDGVTNQIILQSGPAVKISNEGRCFTVAAEDIVKKHDDKGKNKNRTRKLENGLQMKDIIIGNDDSEIASSGDKVYIRYMAWVISTGDVINHAGSLINFEIGDGNVIRGLDIGISGMRVGGKRKLTIPPLLGYGDKAKGEIPANSYLMYEVDLVSVKKCARMAKEAPACMLDARDL